MAAAKRNALAVADPAKGLTIAVPSHAGEIATIQCQAEADLAALCEAGFVVDSAEAYTLADEMLTDAVRRKDAALAMSMAATKPISEGLAVIRSWFKPAVGALIAIEDFLKAGMGSYRVAQAELEEVERRRAMAAAKAGDAETLTEALTTVAQASAAPDLGRTTCRFVWRIKRISKNLLPAEYWTPDEIKISDFGRDHPANPGDPEPVIPGVIWERAPIMGARR